MERKLFGLTGWKNSGKTTLMVNLVQRLIARGYQISTVKHAHHAFDIDQSGKDSFLHRQAGAHEVLISSRQRWALMHELREEKEANLYELVATMAPVDLIMVEGFKQENHPKIQVFRNNSPEELMLIKGDTEKFPNIVAIASDKPIADCPLPVIPLSEPELLVDFIIEFCKLTPFSGLKAPCGLKAPNQLKAPRGLKAPLPV